MMTGSQKKGICFLIVGFFCTSCSVDFLQKSNQVCFDGRCVNVEIARENRQLQRGLMFRESLSSNSGMLFIFPESGIHLFWMKNTRIPLDILWLNERKEIIHIEKKVLPCVKDPCPHYGPRQDSQYVLEINAGYADFLGTKIGETADFYLKESFKK